MCVQVCYEVQSHTSQHGSILNPGWIKHMQLLCRVEELQHQLAHQCSPNIIGIWEWGICGLMGGAFIT